MYNSGNSSKNVTGASVVDGTLENADYADNGLSGDKIDGGTISNFTSTGIDDNATSTAITIDASENVEINTGNLVIGTSGKGIDFSATSDGSGTMTSEVLDDYEEGTFTATLIGTTTTASVITASTAKYTKIGDLVNYEIEFTNVDTTGFAGGIRITGMPFASGVGRSLSTIAVHRGITFTGDLYGVTSGTTSQIDFYQTNSGAAWSGAAHNAIAGVYIVVSGVYKV
jgi:hypothetical protein